jgi:uncharacterized protein (DUF1499 family)
MVVIGIVVTGVGIMLKTMARVFLVGVITALLWLGQGSIVNAAIFSFAGDRPTNLGIHDGRLAPCPPSPNCVSSQASDPQHQIGPIADRADTAQVWADLRTLIASLPNTQIVAETEDYLYAEFTSKLMGFVDDVEFYLTDGGIQVRSASRLGESDLGVNRQRIEMIRETLQAKAG